MFMYVRLKNCILQAEKSGKQQQKKLVSKLKHYYLGQMC